MKRSLDFKAIAQAALNSAEALVPDWLSSGHRDGHEWRCGNLRGDAGKSLAVNLSTGVWADFSTDERGGDLISLYAAIFTGNNQLDAAKQLAERLHMHHETTSAPAKGERAPVKKRRSTWAPIVPVPGDATTPPVAHPVRGVAQMRWTYHDQDGQILGYVHRFQTSDGGKEILPCVWAKDSESGKTDWRWMQFPEPRPLYGLPHLTGEREYVLVVEGEKCVDAAHAALGKWFEVVSWPGGSKAVQKVFWGSLVGRKVILWPDCDAKVDNDGALLPEFPEQGKQSQPGIKAVEEIAKILLGLGCTVRIVKVPAPGELPDGWDVADAFEEGREPETVKDWVLKSLREPLHAIEPAPAQAVMGSSTPEPAIATKPWQLQLIKKPRGGYEDCKENVAIALEGHPQLQGLIGFNEFSARIEKRHTPPWDTSDGEWTAGDDLELSMWLGVKQELLFRAKSAIEDGVQLVANRNKFHPVRDWLKSLEWDGIDRLEIWMRDCLGVQDSTYSRLVGRLWMLQAVNRILNPGCKGDYVLILEGTQGLMKSSALHALGGEWFSDAPLDLNSKDAFMSINGTWIYEIAELDAFNRTEATRIKAFLTQAQDRYRPPYGSRMVTQLRQTVFAATTNNFEYHKDPTGNRRFWSVLCTKVRLDLIKQVREQLFAQAVYEVQEGARVYPTREQETLYIVPEQQMRELVDPWHEAIALWLEMPERSMVKRFTSTDILTGAIKMEIAKIDGQRSATTRVGSIMMRLGWRKVRESTGPRTYFYERPEKPSDSASQTSGQEHEALPI
ncbi:hypothetical protein H0A71_06010 [Alcaligenaceae bacterium]|nr:hypothetical protein [Alcaligenaceae bacterium]